MSHMDPVSGTDIDLFNEGIIPCSPHLHEKTHTEGCNTVLNTQCILCDTAKRHTNTNSPVDELEQLLLLELLVKSRGSS